jgi:hypothetical protein
MGLRAEMGVESPLRWTGNIESARIWAIAVGTRKRASNARGPSRTVS